MGEGVAYALMVYDPQSGDEVFFHGTQAGLLHTRPPLGLSPPIDFNLYYPDHEKMSISVFQSPRGARLRLRPMSQCQRLKRFRRLNRFNGSKRSIRSSRRRDTEAKG